MSVDNTVSFIDSLDKSKNENDIVYFGSIGSEEGVKNIDVKYKNIAVFIGPEGGFSDDEIDMFIHSDIKPARLGSHVLRAETAAIVACGILSI